ncbi:hypothetical protein H6800_01415 [Candidatus Nomurabacteria bacterium]|nr:hypothetical protein [Candidatus Nomurabacteria bacterium]
MLGKYAVLNEGLNIKSSSQARMESNYPDYEDWLVSGFGQAAYMARDIQMYGFVTTETRQRVRNERKGIAIEKLGEPFITAFEYDNIDGCLKAEDGEMFVKIFTRGFDKAAKHVQDDPRLNFLLERFGTDINHAVFLQDLASDLNVPIGTTVVINSPNPSPEDIGVPAEILEDYNYRPREGLAMVWVATKTAKGIRLQTCSLFNAEPEHLAEATSIVSGRPVAILDREVMPSQRTVFLPDANVDIAEQLRTSFDEIHWRETGMQTFHGLQPDQYPREDVTYLVETTEFGQALSASESIIERVAESLVSGEFLVDHKYMRQLLSIKKSDGSYELEGDMRDSVLRVINMAQIKEQDFYPALYVARQGADAIIWSTLRNLYDRKSVKITADISEAVDIGVSGVEEHRQQGTEEYGCPGDGPSNSRQQSIFEMSADQLASAFMRKVFTTNCPLCQEKNVTATQENGTITCGSCSGCVEICTGAVISKSRKQAKIKREFGKLATKNVGIIDWFVTQLISENKRHKGRMPKDTKYEKIAA